MAIQSSRLFRWKTGQATFLFISTIVRNITFVTIQYKAANVIISPVVQCAAINALMGCGVCVGEV